MDEVRTQSELSPVRLRDVFQVFTRPASLFARVEDTGAYGLAFAVLLGLILLIGLAEVKTGLIDRVVDRQTEERLAELEKTQSNLVDRIRLREAMEDVRKDGEWKKLMSRAGAVLLSPAYMLSSLLLISSLAYAVVALTGRKPEYHTLMAVCVYAGFVELVAHVLRLAMMLAYRTIDVGTSLAMVMPAGKVVWLSAIDPFRIWFWVLVAVGLSVTQQLTRRAAIATAGVMCLLAVGARIGLAQAGLH